MPFRSVHLALIRMTIIPIGCAIGFGWAAWQRHERWGEFLFGFGIVAALFVLPFLWKRT